jgi:hypothetical protein
VHPTATKPLQRREGRYVPFATDAPQKNVFFASVYIQNKAALRELRDCEA